MTNCKLSTLTGITVTNIKTGSVMIMNVEYYQNTKTGKMMYSGMTLTGKTAYWLASNCSMVKESNFSETIKVA